MAQKDGFWGVLLQRGPCALSQSHSCALVPVMGCPASCHWWVRSLPTCPQGDLKPPKKWGQNQVGLHDLAPQGGFFFLTLS